MTLVAVELNGVTSTEMAASWRRPRLAGAGVEHGRPPVHTDEPRRDRHGPPG